MGTPFDHLHTVTHPFALLLFMDTGSQLPQFLDSEHQRDETEERSPTIWNHERSHRRRSAGGRERADPEELAQDHAPSSKMLVGEEC